MPSLLPEELFYLVTAFIPTQPPVLRSKAFLVLSAFCRGVRASSHNVHGSGDGPDAGTLTLAQILQPLIAQRLSDAREDDMLSGVTFLCALFQVDWKSASHIFQKDGFVDLVTTLQISPSPAMSLELIRLFAQASGHNACRPLIPVDTLTWIQARYLDDTNNAMRAAAVVALIKLSHGSNSNGTDGASTNSQDEEYSTLLKEMLTRDKETHTFLADALEGLAYLSINPSVKRMLAKVDFLKKIFTFVPKRTSNTEVLAESTLLYGVLVVVSNLCAYKPRLSKEQQQIAKLQRMAENEAKDGKRGAKELPSQWESDAQVQARCRSVLDSGVLDVLATAAGMESQGIKTVVGQVYLNLVEDKANRGRVLQGGGAKYLARIIKSSSTSSSVPSSSSHSEVVNVPAIQALAKLAITSSPIQVFGPNEGNMLDAIRPLSEMLLHSSSSMLQQFEAMMALTNLASHSPTCATRIASTPHLLNKVELLQLEDHTLIRRASTELICNLIGGSGDVFARYAGGEAEASASKSKLQVLLAMSDVEDLPTRSAASGALAMLTSASGVCHALLDLQRDHHRAFAIIAQLIDPTAYLGGTDVEKVEGEKGSVDGDPGLVHRGVVCFHNIFLNDQILSPALIEEAERAELVKVFTKLLKGELGLFDSEVVTLATKVVLQLSPDIS
ncbi:ARM repeat-containing protein [Phlebopus sp. FC_14]|nr:ARM repeat-containing protein [Phlebopus sp. FC_14]